MRSRIAPAIALLSGWFQLATPRCLCPPAGHPFQSSPAPVNPAAAEPTKPSTDHAAKIATKEDAAAAWAGMLPTTNLGRARAVQPHLIAFQPAGCTLPRGQVVHCWLVVVTTL